MSLSISSRIPSFRAPETVLPFKPTVAASTPEVTDPSASSKLPLKLFQNDSFGSEPASGTGDVSAEGGSQGIQDLIKALEELASRVKELGGGEGAPADPRPPNTLKRIGEEMRQNENGEWVPVTQTVQAEQSNG